MSKNLIYVKLGLKGNWHAYERSDTRVCVDLREYVIVLPLYLNVLDDSSRNFPVRWCLSDLVQGDANVCLSGRDLVKCIVLLKPFTNILLLSSFGCTNFAREIFGDHRH